MKKILLFLLISVTGYAQQTNFPYGIKNAAAATDSAPAYFVTSQTDGVHKKTPAALIALKSDLPTSYAVIVYVNAANPNSATIFDDVNPPTTNDNDFKADVDNLYIGTDASTWVYNGSTYVTKTVPATSNFKIVGTGVDAGSNKTSSIYREGAISSDGSIGSNIGYYVNRNGSNTAQIGGFTNYSNAIGSNSMMFQLNASNGLDLWNYASSTWNKRFTFSSSGDLTANSFIKSGGTSLQALLANGAVLTNPISGTGTTGYVSFWNSSTTQTGDSNLFWDNANKRLGIGTSSPSHPFQIDNTTNIPFGTLINSGRINMNATTIGGDIVTQGTRALEINTNLYGSYDAGTLSGLYSNVYNNQTSGNITHQISLVGNAWNKSTGTVLGMYPIYGKIYQDAAGVITEGATFLSQTPVISAGTVTSLNGMLINKPVISGTGVVTNYYGLKIGYSATNSATNNNIDLSINGSPTGPVNASLYINANSNPAYIYTKTTIGGNVTAGSYTGLSVQPVQSNSGAYQHFGLFSEATSNVSSGTLNELRGGWLQARHGNTGTVTSATGSFSSISNASSGVISNAYGSYIATPTNSGGGTITNNYGLFISDQNIGTNKWSLYQAGTSDRNYFAGSVGIGINAPTAVLNIKSGTATAGTAPIKFTSGTLLTTPEVGALEFLTDTYYGTITTGAARKTFAFLESPTFTGTPTAPTATVGTNTTQIANTAFVQTAIGNYKKYVALLSQSGTNAPTATVLENTLGGTIVWTRNSTGLYTGTLAGVFTANKTWTSITSTATGTVTGAVSTSVDTVAVATSSLDSALTNSAIEIRVYN